MPCQQLLTSPFSYDCNGTAAQKWVLSSGTTSIQLAGTNYCLDAGSCEYCINVCVSIWLTRTFLAPANGIQLKIWQCYSGIAAQTWTYTSDHRLQLSVNSKCSENLFREQS